MVAEQSISDKLAVPFPKAAIKQRQGGGNRKYDYVEGHTVIRRLNEATGNQWDLEVREITTLQIGTSSILQARVALTIPGLGTREHLGVQAVSAGGGEDLIKGVITDALKKAATLFGVGLELYGDDYEGTQPAPPITTPPPAKEPTSIDAKSNAMRALHATAMEKFAWTHEEVSIVGRAKYKVDSLNELSAQQLHQFTERLKQIDIDKSAKTLAESRKELAAREETPAEPADQSTRAQRFREM